MSSDQLVLIGMTNWINEAGDGFVTVTVESAEGFTMSGQLPPNVVRALGRTCFEAAEGAEAYSILYRVLKERLGLDNDAIIRMLMEFKTAREG